MREHAYRGGVDQKIELYIILYLMEVQRHADRLYRKIASLRDFFDQLVGLLLASSSNYHGVTCLSQGVSNRPRRTAGAQDHTM